MATKIEIIDNALVISDTVTGDVIGEWPKRDMYFDSQALAAGTVQFYDTNSVNEDASWVIKRDLADCVDATLTPFTEATLRDFGRTSLGFNASSGGSGDLTTVLGVGNVTGGKNIVMTSGDVIESSSGGMQVDLRYGGADGDYFIGSDPSGFTNVWFYGSETSSFEGNFIGYGDCSMAVKPQLNQGFQSDTPITVVKQSPLGVHYGPISFNQSPCFFSTTGSRLSAGQTNTVIAGGNSVIATKGQSLYSNKLILQSPNNQHDAIFDIISTPLTAERNYKFPDENGTVALTDDDGTLTLNGGIFYGTSETLNIAANTNDLAIPNIEKVVLVRLNVTGANDLTGIITADLSKYQQIVVSNVGTGILTLRNNSASSSATNRFLLGGNVNLQSDEGISLVYDAVSLRWRSAGKNI